MTRAAVVLFISIVAWSGATAASAQVACSQKPVPMCSYGGSGSDATSLNLSMQDVGGGKMECRFDRTTMDTTAKGPSLRLFVGGNAEWTVCNQCDVDVTVQLDTWSGSGEQGSKWSDHFNQVIPQAQGLGGDVPVDVACRGTGLIQAVGAKATGQFDSWARVKLQGANPFHDGFDPEIEIVGGLSSVFVLMLLGLGVLAALLTTWWWWSRRRARSA